MNTALVPSPHWSRVALNAERPFVLKGIRSTDAAMALAHVEEHLPPWVRTTTALPKRYLRYREWLVENRLFWRMMGSAFHPSRPAVPGLDMPAALLPRLRRTARLAGSAVDPRESTTLTSRADAIFINTNLRGFYLSDARPVTVKVAIRTGGSAGESSGEGVSGVSGSSAENFVSRLQQEVEVRNYAARFIDIPQILNYDLAGPYPYLVEPVIAGRRPCSMTRDALGEVLVPRLTSMYEDHGYRFQSPGEVVGGEDVLPELEEGLHFVGVAPFRRREMLASASELLGTDRVVATSFVHGDLAPNNIVVDADGNLLVLDWERAGDGLVAKDFFYILRESPHHYDGLAAAALGSQARFMDVSRICTLREQLATLGVKVLVGWRDFEQQCLAGNRAIRDVRRQLGHYCDLIQAPGRSTGGRVNVGTSIN